MPDQDWNDIWADLPDQTSSPPMGVEPEVLTASPPDRGIAPPPLARYTFVTGPAGCGKTTLVRNWCKAEYRFKLCATTGIAAVNLGDAVTVNSMLGYFDTASLSEAYLQGWLQARLRKNRSSGIIRYILDEVSMLEAAQLTLLIKGMEDLNNEASVLRGDEPEIGMTLVGDFLQLPPVQGDFAFQSPEWEEHFAPNVLTMTQIHRQADPAFIATLRALRIGDATTAAAGLRDTFVADTDVNYDGTTIFSKNQEVDRFNRMRHDQLTTPAQNFLTVRTLKEADASGRQVKEPGDWKNIPNLVTLKPGALVMVLANKTIRDEDGGDPYIVYANGDLGEYLGVVQSADLDAEAPAEGTPERTLQDKVRRSARVRLRRTGQEVNVNYNVRQHKRATGAKGKRADAYEILGEIQYMPLRLAYATTVHKSQGLTLDRVQLNIANPFWSAPAMLYVGISRARSLEGLRIVGHAGMVGPRCRFDPRVARWR